MIIALEAYEHVLVLNLVSYENHRGKADVSAARKQYQEAFDLYLYAKTFTPAENTLDFIGLDILNTVFALQTLGMSEKNLRLYDRVLATDPTFAYLVLTRVWRERRGCR